jgi:hypothetical protein
VGRLYLYFCFVQEKKVGTDGEKTFYIYLLSISFLMLRRKISEIGVKGRAES